MRNANAHLCQLPTVWREAKGHLKFIFKDLQSFCLFCTTHPLLRKAHYHLAKQFPRHSTSHDHQEEEKTSVSRPFKLWRASEEAIQTRQHLARLIQAPLLLRFISGLSGPDHSIFWRWGALYPSSALILETETANFSAPRAISTPHSAKESQDLRPRRHI